MRTWIGICTECLWIIEKTLEEFGEHITEGNMSFKSEQETQTEEGFSLREGSHCVILPSVHDRFLPKVTWKQQ